MAARTRPAVSADIPLLVEMMTEFYAESGYPLDPARAGTAFEQLLADPRLGGVWILQWEDRPAGYIVLTLGYSMEYGGRDAFVDDLFVRPTHRGRGLGTLALAEVRAACHELGVRALHLEVGHDNDRAAALYRRAGFVAHDRRLLTLPLADPTHAAAGDDRRGP
jgi:GNAT superfamily N-acetyltransferase